MLCLHLWSLIAQHNCSTFLQKAQNSLIPACSAPTNGLFHVLLFLVVVLSLHDSGQPSRPFVCRSLPCDSPTLSWFLFLPRLCFSLLLFLPSFHPGFSFLPWSEAKRPHVISADYVGYREQRGEATASLRYGGQRAKGCGANTEARTVMCAIGCRHHENPACISTHNQGCLWGLWRQG